MLESDESVMDSGVSVHLVLAVPEDGRTLLASSPAVADPPGALLIPAFIPMPLGHLLPYGPGQFDGVGDSNR